MTVNRYKDQDDLVYIGVKKKCQKRFEKIMNAYLSNKFLTSTF